MLLHVTLLVLASCVLQIGAKLQPFRSPTASVGSRRKGNIPIIANIPGNLIETTGSTIDSTDDDSLQWLRDEADRLSELKARVRSFLQSKNIRVGGAGASSESKKDIENAATELRAIQSTEVNNINCRIGLDPVPVGEIAVSPCDCRGTNEVGRIIHLSICRRSYMTCILALQWIRFSLYNRLRRQDPEQWKTCRTCGADFASTAPLLSTAGPQAMAVSFLLDHPNAIRSIFVAIVVNLVLYSFCD